MLAARSYPVSDESLTPTDVRHPDLVFYGLSLCCTFLLWSCANRLHSFSSALSQCARVAERTDTLSSRIQHVIASAGFSMGSVGVPVQSPLLSAGVAAMGTPFRSPIPLPKRAPRRRASEPARGSVLAGLCDPLLGAVSGSLPPRLQLSLQGRPVGPWWRRDTSQLPEPTFISISTVEARAIGLTNPGTAVSSHRCSYGSSVSLADSVAEARTTMRVFYNAPLRRQALVLSALAAREIKRLLHQPRRMSFLLLALVEHLVTGCVAQHARDRRGRSAPRWSALCGKTSYGFSLSLAERH